MGMNVSTAFALERRNRWVDSRDDLTLAVSSAQSVANLEVTG